MPNLNIPVSVRSIAFIDTQVEDYQSLIAGVKPGTEVVVLDVNRDAIDQITEILALRSNIDSIHIISHGAPGSLQLGDGSLSLDDIECDRQDLQQWFSPRTDSIPNNRPQILLYGCNVAAGETGKAFIKRLSELTGASVAASQNLTGSAAKGGDWFLEVTSGKIATPLAFRPEVLATYNHVLSSFSTATNFSAGFSETATPFSIDTGDFNGDGFPDLAVANLGSRDISILLGTGTGSFGTATNLFNPGNEVPNSIAVRDFNGDGNLDLAVANPLSGANGDFVSIRLGTGTGTFGNPTNFGSGINPRSIAAGDFNGDNRLDLATAPLSGNNLSILLGDGTGSFSDPATIINTGASLTIATADFNSDGQLDLVTSNNSDTNNLSVLLGDGTGNFSAPVNFSAATGNHFVVTGDFNGDSKVDLAVSNTASNNVSVLLGDATGNFGTATNFSVGSSPESVIAGDFNGDGKTDLAASNGGDNNVSVLLGDGTGSFGTAVNFSVGTVPRFIAAGDFNADGKLDLATPNFTSKDVSILLNTPNTINFGAATYSGTEGTTDTVVEIPVTLSGGTPFSDVTVPIAIDPSSTATENSDYTISPTSITFPAGTTTLTQNVAVTIKPDNLPENAETAILNFGTITEGVAGTTKQTTLTIAANDQPSSLSPYQIDLKTGTITGGSNQFISLVNTPTDSNADSWLEAVAKINFDGNIKKAKFIVEYDKAPSGWTVNLGDSASNDGYGGDGSTQSRDAEMNIVNGNMSVFGNDYNTPPSGELTQGNVPNFVSNASSVELEVSNEQLGWDNKSGLKNSLNSPYLYALNGQADDGGPVNSEIYAGFNRVISERPDRIGSGASKVTILLNPIDYAITAGVVTVTEGNEGTTAATFTVTRSGCTDLASTVDYAIAGTADSSDYNNIGGTWGATAATGTINFAAGETSKTITLDVLGDAAIETNETLEVTLSNASVLDSTPTITTATATTTITNDDTAGFTVTPKAISTTEAGGKAEFTLKLNAQPNADVTIGLRSDNVAEGTVSTNSLTFTPANYNEPQTITIIGVDDVVADGPLPYKIVTAAAVSTDVNYNNLDPDDVTVTNSDDDSPGITINPTAGLITGEDGTKANFTAVLNTQPIADVTIGLNTDNVAEGTVSTNSLTFTPANWNAPQPVTVTGVDDSIADGDIDYTIVTGAAVSTDANYSNVDVADVSLSNKDNDTAGVSITPTETTATEGGVNGSYDIQLTSQPIAPVTITITTGEQIQAIAPITFTADNWQTPQTVAVNAVDDTVVEGTHSGNITHSVSSADGKYNVIVVPGVTVAISDNDVAPPPPPTPPTPTPTPVIVEPPTPPTPTPTPVIVEPPTPPTPTPTPVIVEPPTPPTPTPTPVIVEPPTPPTPTQTPVIVEPPTPPTPTQTPVIVEPPTTPTPTQTPVIVEPPTPPTPTQTPVIVEPPTPPTPTPTPVIVEPPTTPTPTPTPVIVEPPTTPTPTPPTPPTPPAIINTQDNWCGLEAGLNKLENILDDQLNTIKLPIVGSLKNIAPNFIDSFKNKLVDAVKNGVNHTTDQLETTLGNVLGSDFNVKVDRNSTQDESTLLITLAKAYQTDANLAQNLGVPGLGLTTDGKAKSTANFDLAIAVGVHKDFGCFIDTEKTKLTANFDAGIDDNSKGQANLGVLQLDLNNNPQKPTKAEAKFAVNLKDLDNLGGANDGSRLTLSELGGNYPLADLFNSTLTANANLGLQAKTSINNNPAFPSLSFDLGANWQAINYTNAQLTAPQNPTVNIDNVSFNWGQTLQGLERSLTQLQDSMNQNLLEVKLPILGKLKDVIPGDSSALNFLNTLKETTINELKLVSDRSLQSTLTSLVQDSLDGNFNSEALGAKLTSQFSQNFSQEVARNLQQALKKYFPSKKLFGFLDWPSLRVIGKGAPEDINLQISLDRKYQFPDVNLSGDLGLPALGFNVNGKAQSKFDGNLSLGFGVNKDFGFYVDTNKTKLEANVEAGLDNNFNAKGELGFFQVDLANDKDSPTQAKAKFAVKLKDLDNLGGADDGARLTFPELTSNYQLSDLLNPTLNSSANLGLQAKTSINGNAAFPSYDFDLAVNWPIVNYANGELTGQQKPKVEFKNMQLDLGSFITGFAKPIITKVNDVVNPARPVITALNSDIELLSEFSAIRDFFDQDHDGKDGKVTPKDGKVTLVEVGAKLAGKKIDTRFLDALEDIGKASDLLNSLSSQEGNIAIDLGDYAIDFDATDPNADTKTANTTQTKTLASPTDQAQSKSKGKTQEFLSLFQKMDGLSFPILTNPQSAIDLLMGKPDVNLFAYQVPKLDFNFKISREFPIYSIPVVNVGVNGKLEGELEAKANFGFGFDTSGLSQWKQSGFNASDAYKVLDGFYVSDRENADGTGPDVNELKLKGSIKAGGGVNVYAAKAYLTGGIEANAKLDLLDVGEGVVPSDKIESVRQWLGYALVQLKFDSSAANYFNPNAENLEAEIGKVLDSSKNGLVPKFLAKKILVGPVKAVINQFGGTGDGKIRGSEITSRISNPLSLFEVNGDLKAALDFKAEYKKYLLLGDWKTAYEKRLGERKVADFRLGTGSTRKSRAIDGYITGGKVFFDANFNGLQDDNEPFAFTNPDGSFDLTVELEKFDNNKDGKIDYTEGKIVITDGIDISTYLPLETQLSSTPESEVVTPLTTVIAELAQQGTNPETAETQVKSALGLSSGIDLTSYDPLEAITQNDPNALGIYAAHAQVQNTIVLVTDLISGASNTAKNEIASSVISVVANQIQSGTLDLSNATQLQAIIQSATSQLQVPQLSSIASDAASIIAEGNQRIGAIASSNSSPSDAATEIARIQKVAQGEVAQDLLQVAAGNKTIQSAISENTGASLNTKIQATTANNPTVRNTLDTDDSNTPSTPEEPFPSSGIELVKDGENTTESTDGDDTLTGSASDDILRGKKGNDLLFSLDGNDWMNGNQGDDLTDGGIGDDTLYGGKGFDTLTGGASSDFLSGNRGEDIVMGEKSDDTLYGGQSNDILLGGQGNDFLSGDLRDDTLVGDVGSDRFLLSTNSGTDTIADFEVGQDLLVLGNGLSFSQLAIAEDSGSTLIRFAQTGEILAKLSNI